ncbi:V-type ATP synthase subunit F [Fusibacter sp. 3D3]|uniref:V-type ATP synthase subunit F n=1 Tax=Fusibacter sp. 3D3 TaxID=1048380 RepID=UPI000852B4EF|nr:V-type ATP synthase subunit F [Fusibacter sp. 3D3]GAU77903.1 V-type ATP synthase subunit F [Fusibacter sp. 3D3]
MKSYCLCEKIETLTAMRLGGVEGELVHSSEEVIETIEALLADRSIGLIMISEHIYNQHKDYIMDKKLFRMDTLIIQIPEPEGLKDKAYIMNYIKHSIGIKL